MKNNLKDWNEYELKNPNFFSKNVSILVSKIIKKMNNKKSIFIGGIWHETNTFSSKKLTSKILNPING